MVQIRTSEGIVGLGETCKIAEAAVGYIHQRAAPYRLGKDPLQIERHSAHLLQPICGFSCTGAEIRGASAIDVALWDIFCKCYGMPVWQALGVALLPDLARRDDAVVRVTDGRKST